ncbi:MAG: hypothetical protein L7W43_18485, partial [Rubripirellula sp.]|nr:hypothetical protein [Rubripirellula sp.]
MSAPHGCNDDTAVIESFKEALTGRVGAERFRMWFTHGVTIAVDSGVDLGELTDSETQTFPVDSTGPSLEQTRRITLSIRGQFALDRLRQNFIREMRGAAMQACGVRTEIVLRLDEPAATQAQLPLTEHESTTTEDPASCDSVSAAPSDAAAVVNHHPIQQSEPEQASSSRAHQSGRAGQSQNSRAPKARSKRGRAQSISSLITDGGGSKSRAKTNELRVEQAEQLQFPGLAPTHSNLASSSQPSLGSIQPKSKGGSGSRTESTNAARPARSRGHPRQSTPADCCQLRRGYQQPARLYRPIHGLPGPKNGFTHFLLRPDWHRQDPPDGGDCSPATSTSPHAARDASFSRTIHERFHKLRGQQRDYCVSSPLSGG